MSKGLRVPAGCTCTWGRDYLGRWRVPDPGCSVHIDTYTARPQECES